MIDSYKPLLGKFLRDSRNICTIKSFQIMNLKEGMTLNFSLYIGFCYTGGQTGAFVPFRMWDQNTTVSRRAAHSHFDWHWYWYW